MKNCLLMESNRATLQLMELRMMGADKMTDTLFVAEEACIDRKIERGVAKIVSGNVNDLERREYNAALMRRAHLVFQMGLSSPRPGGGKRLAVG